MGQTRAVDRYCFAETTPIQTIYVRKSFFGRRYYIDNNDDWRVNVVAPPYLRKRMENEIKSGLPIRCVLATVDDDYMYIDGAAIPSVKISGRCYIYWGGAVLSFPKIKHDGLTAKYGAFIFKPRITATEQDIRNIASAFNACCVKPSLEDRFIAKQACNLNCLRSLLISKYPDCYDIYYDKYNSSYAANYSSEPSVRLTSYCASKHIDGLMYALSLGSGVVPTKKLLRKAIRLIALERSIINDDIWSHVYNRTILMPPLGVYQDQCRRAITMFYLYQEIVTIYRAQDAVYQSYEEADTTGEDVLESNQDVLDTCYEAQPLPIVVLSIVLGNTNEAVIATF